MSSPRAAGGCGPGDEAPALPAAGGCRAAGNRWSGQLAAAGASVRWSNHRRRRRRRVNRRWSHMHLDSRAAIITGASTGIGRACALRFAREGARLVLADGNEDDGRSLARQIEETGGQARFIPADVARREDNERIVDACVERYGRLDILVCNAGITM